jgi:hypothetical protein
MSTQLWPHWVSPASHWLAQAPFEQTSLEVQAWEQAPQCALLLCSDTHSMPHWARWLGHDSGGPSRPSLPVPDEHANSAAA